MSRHSPFVIALRDDERRVLEARARERSAEHRDVLRARIVLAAADGEQNASIAGRLGIALNTVIKWRKRFFEEGMAGLEDRQRPGRPRAFWGETGSGLCGLEDRYHLLSPRTARRETERGHPVGDVISRC